MVAHASRDNLTSGTFADNLRALREERSWTKVELAGRAGISVVMIGRYESGKAHPTPSTIGKLLAALNGQEVVGDESDATPFLESLTEGMRSLGIRRLNIELAESGFPAPAKL